MYIDIYIYIFTNQKIYIFTNQKTSNSTQALDFLLNQFHELFWGTELAELISPVSTTEQLVVGCFSRAAGIDVPTMSSDMEVDDIGGTS